MDIDNIRREYQTAGLRRHDLQADPLKQFAIWFEEACARGLQDPTAMVLATVAADGQPSQRIVLLKHFDADGFVFFTNYQSKKAEDITHNNKVSLLFPWHYMDRQVKIAGCASRVDQNTSRDYFLSRPRESQLAAWASRQSSTISSRRFLLQQFDTMKEKFAEGKVPLPDFWGGYRVVAHSFEFWQGGASRLHDRFHYQHKNGADWEISRLAP